MQIQEVIMNRTSLTLATLTLAAMAAAPAYADEPTKTRAAVRAELAEAIRTGDIQANDDSNLKLYEQRPDLYPQQAQAGKTRAQVQAELAEAVRTGDIVVAGSEDGQTLKEQRPDLYPQATTAGKSRAEVRAELAEAVRNGEIVVGSEGQLTLKQQLRGYYVQKAAVRLHKMQAESSRATRV
jgi:ribosomal protein L30E